MIFVWKNLSLNFKKYSTFKLWLNFAKIINEINLMFIKDNKIKRTLVRVGKV